MYQNGAGVVAVGRVKERWNRVSHEEYLYHTPAEMKLTGGVYEYP
jgi:hypothetical protein